MGDLIHNDSNLVIDLLFAACVGGGVGGVRGSIYLHWAGAVLGTDGTCCQHEGFTQEGCQASALLFYGE